MSGRYGVAERRASWIAIFLAMLILPVTGSLAAEDALGDARSGVGARHGKQGQQCQAR